MLRDGVNLWVPGDLRENPTSYLSPLHSPSLRVSSLTRRHLVIVAISSSSSSTHENQLSGSYLFFQSQIFVPLE